MRGRWKNHTLKGGTSPYSLSMGVPPGGRSPWHSGKVCFAQLKCDHGLCSRVSITRFRVVIREFKQLVRLRLRGRRKTKNLIKKGNSLHVNMHQTDQLTIFKCEMAKWKSLIWGFLEFVNIDTQIVTLFFCFNTKVCSSVDSHSFIQEAIKRNGRQMKEKRKPESWFSVDVVWANSVLAA